MVCEDTLKISNMPKELSDPEKEEFLKHFGASKVRVITSKCKQKSVVFARFESKEVAREVLFRLHQMFILKSRLCVEYAEHDIGPPRTRVVEQTNASSKDHFKSFINKLNAFNSSVDFQQPPPPHLKYIYPRANRLTINNIGHALASVPKFYTQVLHLMNRMNLPPPFAVPPEPSKVPLVKTNNPPPMPAKETVVETKPKESSSESELESDEDSKQNVGIVPQKRKLPQNKPVKRPKFIKPMVAAVSSGSTRPEQNDDVFEKTEMQNVHRKIEMKVSASALEPKPSDREEEKPGRIGIKPELETSENGKPIVISVEELASNQIAAKDLDVLPIFKNYHPGAPTCRLYIKNIAKNVELKDLEYIYTRYKIDDTDDKFDIRLMQEGRMKGQAFVTLSSIEQAQRALKETNAFILKEKPLVVMYAKSAPVKKP